VRAYVDTFRRAGLCALLTVASLGAVQTHGEHPTLGSYGVYTFDPWGNASYAFDLELLTASSPDKPGQYELRMGRVPPAERAQWQGEYEFDAAAMRLRWLSGPLQRSALYRQDAKNPQGGRVVVKNGRWTIFLNNKARGTSAIR
jgi:hypothetical protein